MKTVGELLKSARLDNNLSLDDVSKELNVSKDIIEKFELNDIQVDKDIVFYIGHLRSYCNYLKIDADFILENFKKEISYFKVDVVDELPKPSIENRNFRFKKYFPITTIVFIFISFYILFVNDFSTDEQYALIPDLPENYIPVIEMADMNKVVELKSKNNEPPKNLEINNFTSANASTEQNINEQKHKVTLKILNPTWLQLRNDKNDIIISRLMEKDEEFSYDMNLEYNITSGNAGNILVIIDNNVRGKIGKYGDIVDSFILDKNFNN